MSVTIRLDINTLFEYVNKKLLRHARHPIYDLHIWNYSELVQFGKNWDAITTICRGLITDGAGNIVARSFPKFFNMEELSDVTLASLSQCPYVVREKMDGSLGIIFYYAAENAWIFTSRGSFTSDQARAAERILLKKMPKWTEKLNKTYSYVVEIIYPENKIVVDYGDMSDLVLLTIVNNETGVEYDDDFVTMEAALDGWTRPRLAEPVAFDALKSADVENEEGYVVRFCATIGEQPQRMKIKFATYCRLHKMSANVTVKMIYTALREGRQLSDLVELIPDEFMKWAGEVWAAIKKAHDAVISDAAAKFESIRHLPRKEFATAIKDEPRRGLLFDMYSGKTAESISAVVYDKVLSVSDFEKIFESPVSVTRKQHSAPAPYFIILAGVSGSGKSTWAADMVQKHGYSNVSRDKIRRELFLLETADDIHKYYQSPSVGKMEEAVTEIEYAMISKMLKYGRTVILDNLNLSMSHIAEYIKIAARYIDVKKYVLLKVFRPQEMNASAIAAIIRGRAYNNSISEDVIQKQLNKFAGLFMGATSEREILDAAIEKACVGAGTGASTGADLPGVYIFDIDGTLACNKGGRGFYDWARVGEDAINEPVRATLWAIQKGGARIIICTGRPECAKTETVRWLERANITYDEIHFRPDTVTEKDCVVKKRMWDDIGKRYNIIAMFDDRNQVVDCARELGHTVMQVAYGDF